MVKRKSAAQIAAHRKRLKSLYEWNDEWEIVPPAMLRLNHDLPANRKVAVFKLDRTIIEWKKDAELMSLKPSSWEWFNDSVPGKMKVCCAVLRCAVLWPCYLSHLAQACIAKHAFA
jgi:hypothetical protein